MLLTVPTNYNYENSSRVELVEQALFQLGALYPAIGEEDKAIEAINKIHKSQLDPNVLLAGIYIDKNELKKARELLQSSLYKSINHINFACLGLANSYMKDEKAIDMLNKMIEDIRRNDINKPEKFRSIWCFNEIPEGKRTITMNLYKNIFKVFEAPEFDLVREREEFIYIINELKKLEKKSLNMK